MLTRAVRLVDKSVIICEGIMDNKHRINRSIWHCWRLIVIALLTLASLPGQGSAAPSSGPAQLVSAIEDQHQRNLHSDRPDAGRQQSLLLHKGRFRKPPLYGAVMARRLAHSPWPIRRIATYCSQMWAVCCSSSRAAGSGKPMELCWEPRWSGSSTWTKPYSSFTNCSLWKGTLFFEARENNES